MLGSRFKGEVNPSARELQTDFSNMFALVTKQVALLSAYH